MFLFHFARFISFRFSEAENPCCSETSQATTIGHYMHALLENLNLHFFFLFICRFPCASGHLFSKYSPCAYVYCAYVRTRAPASVRVCVWVGVYVWLCECMCVCVFMYCMHCFRMVETCGTWRKQNYIQAFEIIQILMDLVTWSLIPRTKSPERLPAPLRPGKRRLTGLQGGQRRP